MLVEGLEARALMAAYTGTPLPGTPAPIAGGNDTHTILFTDNSSSSVNQWVWINSAWTAVADLPGFGAGTRVTQAVNDGTMRGFEIGSGNQFLVRNGVRTSIADEITSWVGQTGDPNTATIRLADNGWAVLTDLYGSGFRSWRLKNGVATFLGTFDATINDLGTVLPLIEAVDDYFPRAIFRADGSIVQIPGLGVNPVISDTDIIAWYDFDGSSDGVKVWNSGTVTRTALPSLANSNNIHMAWFVIDAGADGSVLLATSLSIFNDSNPPTAFFLEPGRSAQVLSDITWGTAHTPAVAFPGAPVSLGDSGHIITSSGIATPVDDLLPWTNMDGRPIGAAADADTTVVGGVNVFGDGFLMIRDGGLWTGYRIAGVDAAEFQNFSGKSDIRSVVPYVDPRDGTPLAYVITAHYTFWTSPPDFSTPFASRSYTAATAPWAPVHVGNIDSPLVFESQDARVHLAGLRPDGHLMLYYEWNFPSGVYWGATDLVTTHIEAQGKTFTPVASGLTAFVSPWGSMHIAYLDSAGDVHVVWWAPGLTYWTTDNLSDLAGAPPLHGSLTAYVTPWNGLNIAGTDADGNLAALWWVPQFGSTWRYDRYTGDSAPKLDADSLTSFVTPWGSLNVVGLDATTRAITVYWWTPATNEWRIEHIAVAGGASSTTARSAPVAATPTADGLLQIFFTGEDLHMDRLYWMPGDGAAWNFEDVSAAV